MRVVECAQYDATWWTLRRGVPTASEFHRIITTATAKFAAGHKSYVADLVGDCIDDEYPHKDERATAAMKRGTILEPEARDLYELWSGQTVRQIGFITTDCGRFGASPDFLVGEDGAGEIKCPSPAVFAGWMLDGGLPPEHRAQVHGHLLVGGFRFVDWIAYLPGRPPIVVRVEPDDFTARLADCLRQFDAAYQQARKRIGLSYTTEPLMIGQLAEAV